MDSYSALLNLNFMASLRTDNIILDMFLAALIPFVSTFVYKLLYKQWPEFLSALMDIVFLTSTRSEIAHVGSDMSADIDQNEVLREAVMQYVGTEVVPTYPVGSYSYKRIPSALSSLSRLDDILRHQYSLQTVPSHNEEILLPGKLFLSCAEDEKVVKEIEGEKTVITERVFMSSNCSYFEKKDPALAFVEKSFEWYKETVMAMSSHTRFLYQPVDSASSKKEGGNSMVCQRYPLCEEKTFNTLFFKEKQKLLNLLDDFTQKRGKFSIPGFPHKLVLLLYGPPGTGKTSLVKAIAAHTNRDILAISLSRIQTNHQLISYMFDPSCELESGSSNSRTVTLKTEKVVYMLEDIDAAGRLALRKDAKGDSSEPKRSLLKDECEDSVTATPQKENTDSVDGKGTSFVAPRDPMNGDKLRVSGLLDALNGILDSPNRIVVMTTNHIQHLDPAVVRPGVVTLKLHMGVFDEDTALEMIHHYFRHLNPETEKKIVDVIQTLRVTSKRGYSPAEIEQLCAENETGEELLDALTCGSRVDTF